MFSRYIVMTIFFVFFRKLSADKKIVCYFGGWAKYRIGPGNFQIENIDPKLCTHVIYTLIQTNSKGEITVNDDDDDLLEMASLKEINPYIKLMVAIGEGNNGKSNFSKIALKPKLRQTFAKNAVDFVTKYGLDGCDVDWKYPVRNGKPIDKNTFVDLLRDLRMEFDIKRLILSAAVAATKEEASKYYEIPQIHKYLDFINVVTYDLHGPWKSKTGHSAPLHPYDGDDNDKANLEDSIKYWLSEGAPPEKLIPGIPFYSRIFMLKNESMNVPGSPSIKSTLKGPYTQEVGLLAYNELCIIKKAQNWSEHWDDKASVPYLIKDNVWVSYDNEKSIQNKVDFAISENLGGVMVWEIDMDDFRNDCNDGAFPLLTKINKILGREPRSVQSKPPSKIYILKDGSSFKCTGVGNFKDPENCYIFHQCWSNGKGGFNEKQLPCPKGTIFDTKLNLCNWGSC